MQYMICLCQQQSLLNTVEEVHKSGSTYQKHEDRRLCAIPATVCGCYPCLLIMCQIVNLAPGRSIEKADQQGQG